MGRCVTSFVVLAAAAFISASAVASIARSAPHLHPGDSLAYDLSIEIQTHVLPIQHSTLTPITSDVTVQGTEAIDVLRAERDGSLDARLTLSLNQSADGLAKTLRRNLFLRIAPDNSVTVEGGADPSLAQYVSSLAQAQKTYGGRVLHVGDVFHLATKMPGTLPITANATATVVGKKSYRGYPTFAIQTTGGGSFESTIAGSTVKGNMTTAGTTYFDQADQLFVGGAIRVNVDSLITGPQSGRLTIAETLNIVLHSLTHAARKPPPSSAPAPAPTESPTPQPTPTTEYYTPTPPVPTPSPVVQPYPLPTKPQSALR